MKAQENPFVGLNPIMDEGRFFGRELEIRRLTELLIAERIVLLYSPSGAGKTSLIKAGLIPRLIKRKFKVHPVMRVVEGADNASVVGRNRYLASALSYLEVSGSNPEKKEDKTDGRKEFSDYLNEPAPNGDVGQADYLNESSYNGDVGPAEVFIFDQFEEILTHDPHDVDRKREFFDRVGLALQDQRRWALFAMREDYIAGLDPYRRYIPTHLTTTYRLNLLSRDAAIEAVQETAQAAQKKEALASSLDDKTKYFFTDKAAEKLINNLAEVRAPQSRAMAAGNGSLTTTTLGQYIEPVHLQVVCQRLWKELPENICEITPDHIDDCGNVDTSLEAYYSDAVKRVADNTKAGDQRGIREWFDRHLLTREGLRTQVMLGDAATDRLGDRTVNELINAYLVREDKRNDIVWLELAHDRLITPVRNDNNKWFKEKLSHLEACARAWDGEGRPASLLLAGAELESATDWVRERRAAGKELMEHEKVFLAECERAENLTAMLKRRSNKYRRGFWLVSFIATLFIVIGGVVAGKKLKAAAEQQEIARLEMEKADKKIEDAVKALEKANREAADAHALAENVVSEANKTVLEANKKAEAAKLAARQDAKRIVDEASNKAREYVQNARIAKDIAERELSTIKTELEDAIITTQRIQDKEKIATGSVNRLLTLESASQISRDAMKDHDNPKSAVNRLLDAMKLLFPYASASGQDDAAMQSLCDRLTDLQILLPSILLETTIRDCQTGAYNCESSSIQSLGFTEDGQSLITASDNGNVYKYDLKNKSSRQTIDIDFKKEISSVAVDPKTGQIAVGYFSGDVKIYGPGDIKTPISGHRHTVHRLLFKPEPDGSLLAAASKFWTFSVSRLKRQASSNGALDHKRLYRKPKNMSWMWAVLVKAKSTRLVNDFAFVSRNNSPTLLLAVAREDGRLEVLEAISGKGVSTISLFAEPSQHLGNQTGKGKKSSGYKNKPQDALLHIASSPDGNWLATAGKDGNIYVWDIQDLLNNPDDNQPAAKLPTLSGAVQSLAFSPESNLLASVGQDSVRIWELENSGWRPAVSQPLIGHEGVINTLVFFTEAEHKGLRLATADSKGITKIWRIPSGRELNRLNGFIERLQNALIRLDETKSVSVELTSLIEEVRRYINR